MNCAQVQPKIADYSVGLLRANESEQVEGHLAACPACAREWRELQAVLGMVERFGAREPPPHLWNGVYNRITAEPAPAAPGFWERLWNGPGRLVAGTATGFATAALLAALFLHPVASIPIPTVTPVQRAALSASSATAAQQHAMLAGFEPLADEVGLEAYARLIDNSNEHTDLTQ